jgi:hypothetical protein
MLNIINRNGADFGSGAYRLSSEIAPLLIFRLWQAQ